MCSKPESGPGAQNAKNRKFLHVHTFKEGGQTFKEGVHFLGASILIYCTCGISPPYFVVID
jgi:hypothetical protein